jgi:hypothetical protein
VQEAVPVGGTAFTAAPFSGKARSSTMPQSVLVIGENPDFIDFSDPGMPPDIDAQKIMEGLNASRDRLNALGFKVDVLMTKDAETVEDQVSEALKGTGYDVIVIGAGLRLLPAFAEQFERLINVLREKAPKAKLAFNSRPSDTDEAALRWLRKSAN